jgi:hypothetical protein
MTIGFKEPFCLALHHRKEIMEWPPILLQKRL